MKKLLAIVFLMTLLVGSLIMAGNMRFSSAQTGTSVSGIMHSDTIWTKAGSPYIFNSPFGVGTGVTLTIEPGVTINFNGFNIVVNGTLNARGTSSEQIYFNITSISYNAIAFTQYSNSWNEQTGTGCIIENAHINAYRSNYALALNNNCTKINNNTISGNLAIGNNSIISNNRIIGNIFVGSGSPRILNNNISSTSTAIFNVAGTPIITNNFIKGESKSSGTRGIVGGGGFIYGNTISGFEAGIGGTMATVERNLITDNYFGIDIGTASNLIQNNTIANNVEGFFVGVGSPTIIYNNIQNNTHSVFLNDYVSSNRTAAFNWWGTSYAQEISQTLHNAWRDFNLFTVNFVPFLTAPNSQAEPDSNMPIPTPSPEPSPTQAPAQTFNPTQTPTPAMTPTGTLNASASLTPTLNPTATPNQADTQVFPQTVLYIIIGVLAAVVIALVVAVTVLFRRVTKLQNKQP